MGHGVAAYAKGNFYAEPAPAMTLRSPSRFWHWSKIYLEKWWLRHWFCASGGDDGTDDGMERNRMGIRADLHAALLGSGDRGDRGAGPLDHGYGRRRWEVGGGRHGSRARNPQRALRSRRHRQGGVRGQAPGPSLSRGTRRR